MLNIIKEICLNLLNKFIKLVKSYSDCKEIFDANPIGELFN
jgi:hypothetical protein